MEEEKLEKIENINEQKWFSFLKKKAKEQGFGTMKIEILIRKGKISRIQNIRQIENFNVEG